MLDINLIREKTDEVRNALLKRMDAVDFSTLLQRDKKRREVILESDKLKAKRNETSTLIPKLKKQGEDTSELLKKMKIVSASIKELDAKISELDKLIRGELLELPNIPADDVIAGGKECNEVTRTFGTKPDFSYKFKDHVELVKMHNLIDYERGVKLGGNGFWLYRGDGAKLEWGLLNFFVEEHLSDGYEFIMPPHILTYQCGITAGQFPKFEDDVFHIESEDGKKFSHFLLPTAETALINFHRDEVLKEDELPRKYFSYTPCYRKEAGSYRTEERGMIRGHQFNKIEMFQFTKPEDSDKALEELIGKAERIVQKLGLHYRLSKLAAKDVSATMAKTYDIEIWIPSMDDYKEVSSASNSHEYQARRGNIRFKRTDTKKNEFVHSLNASGLATSRLLPAIVEQFQQEDGSIIVPEPLRKWVGKDVLSVGQ